LENQWNALKGCQAPIHCENNFHVEYYRTEEHFGRIGVNQDFNHGKVNCTGSITVYTKPKFKGDDFTTEESLHQVMLFIWILICITHTLLLFFSFIIQQNLKG